MIFHSYKFYLVLVSGLVYFGCIYKNIHFQHKSKYTVHSENKTKRGKKETFRYRKSSNDKRRGQKKKKGKNELQNLKKNY